MKTSDGTALDNSELTVAAVARMLGVAPATLRTWDRRYGLGPTIHSAGDHRRYSPEDVAVLGAMRRLVIMGVAPAEAAHRAKSGEVALPESKPLFSGTCPHVDYSQTDILFRAAHAFNREILESVLRKEIADNGVVEAWNCVLMPLLVRIGEEWANDGSGIEIEHFVTEIVKRVLAEPLSQLKNPINARPALLACVGEEIHSLALRALAAALAEINIDSQFLGARTPQSALNEVIRRSAPPAIFLWAQLKENASLDFVHDIPAIRPAPRIIVGGPGWLGTDCNNAVYASDLVSARQEIARAIGA